MDLGSKVAETVTNRSNVWSLTVDISSKTLRYQQSASAGVKQKERCLLEGTVKAKKQSGEKKDCFIQTPHNYSHKKKELTNKQTNKKETKSRNNWKSGQDHFYNKEPYCATFCNIKVIVQKASTKQVFGLTSASPASIKARAVEPVELVKKDNAATRDWNKKPFHFIKIILKVVEVPRRFPLTAWNWEGHEILGNFYLLTKTFLIIKIL